MYSYSAQATIRLVPFQAEPAGPLTWLGPAVRVDVEVRATPSRSEDGEGGLTAWTARLENTASHLARDCTRDAGREASSSHSFTMHSKTSIPTGMPPATDCASESVGCHPRTGVAGTYIVKLPGPSAVTCAISIQRGHDTDGPLTLPWSRFAEAPRSSSRPHRLHRLPRGSARGQSSRTPHSLVMCTPKVTIPNSAAAARSIERT